MSSGEGVLDHADLRAVAVGDDDLVALLDEAEQRVGGVGDLLDLLFRGVAEGVAAEGDDDAIGLAKGLDITASFLLVLLVTNIHQLTYFMQYTLPSTID